MVTWRARALSLLLGHTEVSNTPRNSECTEILRKCPVSVYFFGKRLPVYTRRHLRLEINKWTKSSRHLLHNVSALPTAPIKDRFVAPYIWHWNYYKRVSYIYATLNYPGKKQLTKWGTIIHKQSGLYFMGTDGPPEGPQQPVNVH
jgi:hypothetical protein